MSNDLQSFFSPKGVALIGASPVSTKLSYGILENMTRYNYQGRIYPVNPNYSEILNLVCYPDISKVPDPVELAVVILPANATPEILEACGKRGVKAVIIISGGFKEVGAEGALLEEKCLDIARQYEMRLIGPNCVGTMDLFSGLNTTFINGMPERGGIGFLSQSGAVCGGIVDYISGKGVGFSHFISLGNEADVTETDIIEYLGNDPHARVIAAYVEAIRDGRRFIDVASRVTRKKPVILLKAGRSEAGARAVSSHTGSLAGSYAAYQAAFRQSGVIEADSLSELFDIAVALDYQPLPGGNRTVILTNAGGPAALASDYLSRNGLVLDDLEPKTKEALRKVLMPAAQVANPVDMLGGASPQEYGMSLKTILEDGKVDAVVAVNVPTSLVNPVEIASAIGEAASHSPKPVVACMVGDKSIGEARRVFHQYHIPMAVFPENIGGVLGAMNQYANWRKTELDKSVRLADIDNQKAKDILSLVKSDISRHSITGLGEAATRPLFQAYGIPVVGGDVARNEDEAIEIADHVGYPVAMKIVSPDILHKSDVGGIVLNLTNPSDVRETYQNLLGHIRQVKPDAKIEGVLIEKMAPKGSEVIIGMRRDPNFGPLMMFGFGGVFVELFKDVGFCVAPLSRQDALKMITQTKAGKMLGGLSGQKPMDIDAVVDCILRLSQLALDHEEISEVEVNPLLVLPEGKGALALDGRVIIG